MSEVITMPEVGALERAIEHLDWRPPCEAKPECKSPAEVICYMRCGCLWLFSRRCRDREAYSINASVLRAGERYSCIRCNFDFGTAKRWEELTAREVPL